MTITSIFESALVQAVGWALLHLLWQATLVAFVLGLALQALRRQAAAVRYLVACAALGLVALLPGLTAWNVLQSETKLDGAVSAQPLRGTPTGSFLVELQSGATAATGSGPAPSTLTLIAPTIRERLAGQLEQHLPLMVTLWVLGVFFSSSRVIFAWLKLRHMAMLGATASPEWQHALARLTRRIRLSRPIRLLESSLVEVPTVIGWLRPVVLLPVSALTGLTRQQLETILAHELAHVRRHDFVVNLFQTFVETLLFYHPAVWWISTQIRVEREHCCDDLAVELCGNPLLYARALAELEQTRFPVSTPALALSGGSLLHRITRLISGSPRRCSAQWLAGVSVVTVLISLAIAAPLSLLAMREAPDVFAGASEKATPVRETLTVASAATEDDEEASEWRVESKKPAGPPKARDPKKVVVKALPASDPSPAVASAISKAVSAAIPGVSGTMVSLADRLGTVMAYAFANPQEPPQPPEHVATPKPPRTPEQLATPKPLRAPKPVVVKVGDKVVVTAPTDFDFDLDFDHFDFDFDFDFEYDHDDETTAPDGEKDKPLDRSSLTIEDLIRLKHAGVTPEYIQELERAGYRNLTLREVISLAHAGVSASDIAEFQKMGLGDLSPREITRLSHAGVDPEYIQQMRKAGFANATARDLIRLAHAGVDAEDVAEANKLAGRKLSVKEITALKHMGVDRSYVEELARSGFSGLAVEEMVKWKALGVTPEFAAEMRAAGFPNLSANEIVQLRAAGVDEEFIRSLREAGITNLTARELIKLKHAGVDADFIREMKKKGN